MRMSMDSIVPKY